MLAQCSEWLHLRTPVLGFPELSQTSTSPAHPSPLLLTVSPLRRQRHTSFYCDLLYWTLQILHFFLFFFLSSEIEGLWQPCMKQVYQDHSSNSVYWLHVSLVPFWESLQNLKLFFFFSSFLTIVFVLVICDQWPLFLLQLAEGSDDSQLF